MRYSLISNERKLSDAQVKRIVDLLANLEIPSAYLQKNSPTRFLNQRIVFNDAAQTFIAIVHLCATSENDDYSLADLVEILKKAIIEYKGKRDIIDQIIACLAYTLRTQQFIALFLEFAPNHETFSPTTGWCRGSSFYDFFFPILAEAVSKPYLDELCAHIFQLVQESSFTEEQMSTLEGELKAKTPMSWEALSEESRVFTKSLITPSIHYLIENKNLLPSEIKTFLYQCRCYLTDFRREDVDPLEQLGGLFFLKFTLSEIVQPDRAKDANLSDLQIRELKIISANIQRLATKAKDSRLLELIDTISVESPLSKDYLPFKDSDGSSPAMRSEKFEKEAIHMLTEQAPALSTKGTFDESESTPRDSQTAGLLLIGHEQQPLLARRPSSTRCVEWNHCNIGLLMLGALLTMLGATFGNSALLEAEGLLPVNNTYSKAVGPVASSFVGGSLALLLYGFFLLIFLCKSSRAHKTSESTSTVFHRRVGESESEASAVEEGENLASKNPYQ